MKILFFSDVHGSPDSLALVEQQAERLKPEQLVLLGDILYHGPRNPLREDYAPQKVAAMLNPRKNEIIAVRGNCDCEVDQMLLEFPVMAEFSTLFIDGHRFFLTHGHHWNPGEPPPVPAGTVLAYGHTHIPWLEKLDEGIIAFNPGSISLPKGGNPPSFGLYDDGRISVINLATSDEMMNLVLS